MLQLMQEDVEISDLIYNFVNDESNVNKNTNINSSSFHIFLIIFLILLFLLIPYICVSNALSQVKCKCPIFIYICAKYFNLINSEFTLLNEGTKSIDDSSYLGWLLPRLSVKASSFYKKYS